ncbi:MAG: helix-turn-helix domain-containing protein [Bacteroidales bacterium]|nr:helix-turn-helix domain-containing protein [Bacteroidales bacterium]
MKIPTKILIWGLGAAMSGAVAACTKGQSGDIDQIKGLSSACYEAAMEQDYDLCDSIATNYVRQAQEADNKKELANALYYRGLYNFNLEDADNRRPYLMQALELAKALDNPPLLCKIYNALGIYEVACYHRYAQAHKYFTQSLAQAKILGDRRMQIVAETNLSEVYRVSGDTMALRYDLDIYRYATDMADSALINSSAFHLAKYYFKRKGEADKALPYIDAVARYGEPDRHTALMGEYYLLKGNLRKAQTYLESILVDPNTETMLLYADLLSQLGKYQQSNATLDTLTQLANLSDAYSSIPVHANQIYAYNYQQLGNLDQALHYLRLFSDGRDSIQNLHNQQELSRYKVEYELDKKESEMAHQRELVKRARWHLGTIIGALVLVLGIVLWHMRRQTRLYRSIVAQNREFIEREKALSKPTQRAESTGLTDQRMEEIYALILHELEENQIYRDITVTRDTFAERVGCNHTYFTQVIREKAQMSYLQLMNSYRIREALRVLSAEGPEGDVTMQQLFKDLGFLSMSTFYKAFKAQVGMSPSVYRRTLKQLPDEAVPTAKNDFPNEPKTTK